MSPSASSMVSTWVATRSWRLAVWAPISAHCSAFDSSMRRKLLGLVVLVVAELMATFSHSGGFGAVNRPVVAGSSVTSQVGTDRLMRGMADGGGLERAAHRHRAPAR